MRVRCHDPAGIADRLLQGQVGILPTDTLPGLHCRADDDRAVARIRELKGRRDSKPLLVLCADSRAALALADQVSDPVREYVSICWPGPFTLIFKAGIGAPSSAVSPEGSIAIRVPAEAWLADILQRVAVPLVSTSANPEGEAPAVSLQQAEALFGDRVDFTATSNGVDRGSGGHASCLLDMRGRPPVILRPGELAPPVWRDE